MRTKTAQRRGPQRHDTPGSQGGAEGLFESVVTSFLGDSRVSRSRMFGSMGLKVGGKVFAMLVKGRLVVKLPKERVEALVASGGGEYFDPGHGRIMKEWVAVEPGNGDWQSLAREAKHFVARGQ